MTWNDFGTVTASGSVPYPTGAEVIVDLTSADATLTVAAHGKKSLKIYSPVPGRSITLPDATGFASVADAIIGGTLKGYPIKIYNAGTVNTDQVLEGVLMEGPFQLYSTSKGAAKGNWAFGSGKLYRGITHRSGASAVAIDIGTNGFHATYPRACPPPVTWSGSSNNTIVGTWGEATTDDVEGVAIDFDTNHAPTAGSLTAISATANALYQPSAHGRSDADGVWFKWWDSTVTATMRGVGATIAARVFTLGSAIDIVAGLTTVGTVTLGDDCVIEDFGEGGDFWMMNRTGSGQALASMNLSGNTLTAGDNLLVGATAQKVRNIASYADGKCIYIGENSAGQPTLNHASCSNFATTAPSEDWESVPLSSDCDQADGVYLLDATAMDALCSVKGSFGIVRFTASGLVDHKDFAVGTDLETTIGIPDTTAENEKYMGVGPDMALVGLYHANTQKLYIGLFRPSERAAWLQATDKHEIFSIPMYPVPLMDISQAHWQSASASSILGWAVNKDTKNIAFSWNRATETGANFYARYCVGEIPRNI